VIGDSVDPARRLAWTLVGLAALAAAICGLLVILP
jgi:hypothetical protein